MGQSCRVARFEQSFQAHDPKTPLIDQTHLDNGHKSSNRAPGLVVGGGWLVGEQASRRAGEQQDIQSDGQMVGLAGCKYCTSAG